MRLTYKEILHTGTRCIFEVQANQMFSELSIKNLVHLVEYKIQQVESGNECRRQVNVPSNRHFYVVFRPNWIGRSKNRGSCIKSGDNTGFGYRYSLLFLVNIST
jgi:hypothetical protein